MAIRDRALALGFDAVGFAPAGLGDRPRRALAEFLAAGWQGDMGWLADRAAWRGDPAQLWPEARSVIVLGTNYGPAEDPLALAAQGDRGDISVYARNRDYHELIKGRLKQLAGWLARGVAGQPPIAVKVFVDTAPVMEKPLAQAAGLGWQGKHTNLVSRDFGSWLFLGEIFTTLELTPDPPAVDHCGTCRRCLDICPTRAFPEPYRLDARRCISYLTIEHQGPIDPALRPLMGNRIYGCDDCVAVCPWNRFARATAEPALQARPDLTAPALAELVRLDDAGFRRRFSGSPIKRIGRDRFVRNVLIALGNSGDAAQITAISALVDDPAPVVRDAARWALAQLEAGDYDPAG
ncbi:MAG: tRNA epoxyqueuosine(34) reductase QueG [Azospirillaceae bacterium]|nr:tRNA epoxyqueuosine(34) reductase QueG [Azospirillaceae bacterium]